MKCTQCQNVLKTTIGVIDLIWNLMHVIQKKKFNSDLQNKYKYQEQKNSSSSKQ